MTIVRTKNSTELTCDDNWSSIIKSERHRCKKICFDIDKIKKIDKVYSAYKIPKEEKIIAYCKDSLPLIPITVMGTVFTNQAVYRCPSVPSEKGTEFQLVKYSALGSGLIVQDGPKGGVFFYTQNDEFRLIDPTLMSNNVAGTEVRCILRKLQIQLLRMDASAKKESAVLCDVLLQRIKAQMGIEELSAKLNSVLEGLMEFAEYSNRAAMLKAEYLFREFRPQKYEAFVESLPKNISHDVREAIKRIPEEFVENYIELITDVDRKFRYKDISALYERIDGIGKKEADLIRAYLRIRMNDYRNARHQIKDIANHYGSVTANPLKWFHCVYAYYEMQKVYDAIKDHKEYPVAYQKYRDGFGLTPLHYAIILKEEKAIKEMLSQKNWQYASPQRGTNLFAQMYEYVVPASGNQLPYIEEILLKTHEDTIEINNEIRKIKHQIQVNGIVTNVQETNWLAHNMEYMGKRSHNASDEELNELVENIDSIEEFVRNRKEELESLEEILTEYERSIKCTMENAIDEALSLLDDATTSEDPLVKYLYRLYFEPEFFEEVLSAIKERRNLKLYQIKDFYFIAPEFAEVNLPYQDMDSIEEDKKTKTNSYNRPLYGNSWFSSEAHHSIDVLKTEYRKLAKTYHPDVCQMANSKQIFQQISKEYSELLNSLSL